MKVSIYNDMNIDTLTDVEVDAWPLLAGETNPTKPDYNPDGFVVTFSLPAPFEAVRADVIIPWSDADALSEDWREKRDPNQTTITGILDLMFPEGGEVTPLNDECDCEGCVGERLYNDEEKEFCTCE